MENFYQHVSDWYQPIYTRPSAGTVLKGAVKLGKAMARKYGSKRKHSSRVTPFNKRVKAYHKSTNAVGKKIAKKNLVAPPTTNQENIRTTYHKRPVSRWRKRKAVRRFKNFRRMQFRAIGTAHQVYNTSFRSTTLVDEQGMEVVLLKGANGSQEKESHLRRLAQNMVSSSVTNQTRQKGKNFISNGVVDFQLKNNTGEVLIIDLYYFICKKDLPKSAALNPDTEAAGTDSVRNLLGRLKLRDTPTQTASTTMTIKDIGVTPFQSPEFGHYFTVVRKEHFQLNSNQIMTGQMKSQKANYYSVEDVEDLVAKKYVTSGVVVVYKTVFDGTSLSYPAATLDFSQQYTYNVKRMERTTDTAFIDPSLT